MWVSPAVVRCTKRLLCSSSSFPKPKFLSASGCLLDSYPTEVLPFDSPASVAAAVNQLKHHPDPDLAFFFLHLDSCGFPLDQFGVCAYTAVLRGLCAEMKLEEAEQVLVDMEEHGIVADVYSYAALIHGHCKSFNLPRALALHDYMLSKGIKSNCVIISTLLQCFCDMGMPHEAVHQFNEFKESGIFLDEVTYNIAVVAL
ncbi:hypothetical protein NL676_007019 [Syzygium grande]|nr:hypothetical protein NL676_007019 [Syzygium grande]